MLITPTVIHHAICIQVKEQRIKQLTIIHPDLIRKSTGDSTPIALDQKLGGVSFPPPTHPINLVGSAWVAGWGGAKAEDWVKSTL